MPLSRIVTSACIWAGFRKADSRSIALSRERYSLEQINEACHDLRSGAILGRAILEY